MKRRTTLLILLSLILAFAASSERSILAQDVPTAPEAPNEVQAAITPLISYQGRLLEGGAPVSGVRSMTFNLYNAASAGTSIWNETQSVTVTDGLFQVALGSVTPFNDAALNQMSQNLWLEINVAGNILPRQQLMGAPYALSLAPGASVAGSGIKTLGVGNTGDGAGIWSYSELGHGVIASSSGGSLTGSALLAEAYGPDGIAVWALNDSMDTSLVVSNDGAGPLVKGFGGDGGEHEFMITNDGSVYQEREASGLVKAAVLALCADGKSQIVRFFNNAAYTTIGITYKLTGACSFDFGFPVNDRYYMVTAPALEDYPNPTFASCGMDPAGSPNEMTCVRQYYTGEFLDGYIMIVVY